MILKNQLSQQPETLYNKEIMKIETKAIKVLLSSSQISDSRYGQVCACGPSSTSLLSDPIRFGSINCVASFKTFVPSKFYSFSYPVEKYKYFQDKY